MFGWANNLNNANRNQYLLVMSLGGGGARQNKKKNTKNNKKTDNPVLSVDYIAQAASETVDRLPNHTRQAEKQKKQKNRNTLIRDKVRIRYASRRSGKNKIINKTCFDAHSRCVLGLCLQVSVLTVLDATNPAAKTRNCMRLRHIFCALCRLGRGVKHSRTQTRNTQTQTYQTLCLTKLSS